MLLISQYNSLLCCWLFSYKVQVLARPLQIQQQLRDTAVALTQTLNWKKSVALSACGFDSEVSAKRLTLEVRTYQEYLHWHSIGSFVFLTIPQIKATQKRWV